MTSKQKILEEIKKLNIIDDVELPNYKNFGIKYKNKIKTFSSIIESTGGQSICIEKKDLDKTIINIYKNQNTIASNVEYCKLGNINLNKIIHPKELENLDLAIIKGDFAVAENAAIWIKDTRLKHRVLYFIPKNLILVINENNIVNNMHEAYEKINFDKPEFGIFISGPSKTADIEQSLVIGAQGAESACVIFVKE